MVSSNPYVDPSPRIKVSFPLISICRDELISAPKIMTFLPMRPSINEYSEQETNPMPWPLYLYLSRSAFLVSFKNPNKQLFNLRSLFKFRNHGVSV